MKGMWTKCLSETGQEYYYNAALNVSKWHAPVHDAVHVATNLAIPSSSSSVTQPIIEEGELVQYQQQLTLQQQQQQQYEMQYQQQQYEFMLQYQQMNEQQQYEYMQQYQQQQLLLQQHHQQQQHAQFSQYNNVTSDSINEMLIAAAQSSRDKETS